jgi:multiple sugar transport system ATP-binding protein
MYELVGAEAYLYFDAEDTQLTARVNSRVSVKNGEEVSFVVDLTKIHIFDKETKLRIAMND